MKWTKFTLETTTEAVDPVSNLLCELGIEGIEIIDNIQITEEERKQLFIDFLPELKTDDGTAKVCFYLDTEEDVQKAINDVKDGLKELSEFVDIGNGNIAVTETEDKDWINNWKQFFKPFRIDDTIVIKPTWEQLPERRENDLVIEIDPGTSFGTGSHETTKLCILSLKKYLKPEDTVLDAGSGSGILSVIAKKLGAKEVTGVDIDPIAMSSALENARINHLNAVELINSDHGLQVKHSDEGLQVDNHGLQVKHSDENLQVDDYGLQTDDSEHGSQIKASDHGLQVKSGDNRYTENGGMEERRVMPDLSFITGNILEDHSVREHLGRGKYDLVVANILADVIIPLSGVIGENLKPGGIFISSGIINTKEKAVREALLKNNFKILEVNRMGDWVSFTAKNE